MASCEGSMSEHVSPGTAQLPGVALHATRTQVREQFQFAIKVCVSPTKSTLETMPTLALCLPCHVSFLTPELRLGCRIDPRKPGDSQTGIL